MRIKCNAQFFCDFHLMSKWSKLLINYRFTPLVFDSQGKVHLMLCTASFFGCKKTRCAQLYMSNLHQISDYSFAEHSWLPPKSMKLTDVEKMIIWLSERGYHVNEIAKVLCKSENTVKGYRKALFDKLGVKSIMEAISVAVMYRLC